MNVGKKLRVLRSKNQFSQQDIADYVSVDRKTYINWENETSDIKSEYIPKLAEKFGIEIKDLFEKTDNTIIIQEFNENTFNSVMVMMITDRKMMTEVLKILKQEK